MPEELNRVLGLDLPVYPVKGYSITVPVSDADGAPVSTVMDESYKVAITRLGTRIRVGGTAEISGYSNTLDAARRALTHPAAGVQATGSIRWCEHICRKRRLYRRALPTKIASTAVFMLS